MQPTDEFVARALHNSRNANATEYIPHDGGLSWFALSATSGARVIDLRDALSALPDTAVVTNTETDHDGTLWVDFDQS